MRFLIASAGALLLAATPALAQNTTTDSTMADPVAASAVPAEEDDEDFPWGLLGLLGLAGLLGRRRVEHHVDTTRRT